jgi:hypothetical protein
MPTAPAMLKSFKSRKVLLWRCFWALVLLLHAPITWHVITGNSASRWSSILLLILANAFFLLEICAPCCIKLVTDRRSAVIFLMIIALLHVGVLERGFPALAATWDHGSTLLCTLLGTVAVGRLLSLYVARFLSCAGNVQLLLTLRSYLSRSFPLLVLAPKVRARPYSARRGPPLH